MVDTTLLLDNLAGRTGDRPNQRRAATCDVSIVLPCLNEAQTLPGSVARALTALSILRDRHGLSGEVVVADNGSTDGSQDLARRQGARVVPVQARGYGSALIGGLSQTRGRYLVMGDSDGSYDFVEAVPMIEALRAGHDLCMGSRFRGRILPGAMPWKNRHIGNPVLTGILNVLFRSGISDAHCGLRALTRESFDELRLRAVGMEFASEMVVKASLLGLRMAEVPVTLHPDGRDRPPHLRPWRDGWRHLRYLLMLSPLWLFAVPAVVGLLVAAVVLGGAVLGHLDAMARVVRPYFGDQWVIFGCACLTLSHQAAIFAATAQVYGIREGYRRPPRHRRLWTTVLRLETMLILGLVALVVGLGILGGVFALWTTSHFAELPSVLPAALGTALVVIGNQNILGGFIVAIVGGNEADPLAPADVGS